MGVGNEQLHCIVCGASIRRIECLCDLCEYGHNSSVLLFCLSCHIAFIHSEDRRYRPARNGCRDLDDIDHNEQYHGWPITHEMIAERDD